MAILNLAGNFQPSSVPNGRSLPEVSSRAPSASSRLENSEKIAAELNQVSQTKSSDVEKVSTTENQKVEANKDDVRDQIEEIQQFNQSIDRSLQFKVDEELGVTIVRVIDKETDELIRQFPPEELINLSRRLKELNEQNTGNSGVLLQEKV